MTTFSFTLNGRAAFKFQPTLDGAVYSCVVPWNLFAQRYYLNVNTLNGALILARSLISSPEPFSAVSASWSSGSLSVGVNLSSTYKIGSVVRMNFSGFSPSACNGQFDCVVRNSTTLVADLATDPGPITVIGTVSYDVNLIGGYFSTSTLVYRGTSQQFEVNP